MHVSRWLVAAVTLLCTQFAQASAGDLITTMTDPSPVGFDYGAALSASKTNLFVTCLEDSATTTFAGAVYQYGKKMNFVRKYESLNPQAFDSFGWSTASGGKNTVFISSPGETVNGAGAAGRTYAFDVKTGAWKHTFERSPVAGGAIFGYRVAASSKILAIAAVDDATVASQAGAVYLYDAVTFEFRKVLLPPVSTAGQHFGQAMLFTKSLLLVSSDGNSPEGADVGRVYVYSATTGDYITTILHPQPAAADGFGLTLAASSTSLYVGAWKADVNSVTGAGAVDVFDLKTFASLGQIPSPEPNAGARFGGSLSATSSRLLVGAPHDSTFGPSTGKTYLYDVKTRTRLATMHNPFPFYEGLFGESVAFFSNLLVVGAPDNDRDTGDVYLHSAK
jgi:hypothetical protein